MLPRIRIARPTADVAAAAERYRAGLGLEILGRFQDHEGFDGAMVGLPGGAWHLELTRDAAHPVRPTPTDEDLLVLYLPDPGAYAARCAALEGAGFRPVASRNPYWDAHGRTFEDPEGYRVVVYRGSPPGQ